MQIFGRLPSLLKVDMIFVKRQYGSGSDAYTHQRQLKAKKPVYVGADSMVMDGGLATVGIDYTDLEGDCKDGG